MESFVDHGYSGIDDGTKVCNFLKWIKSPELKAEVNNVLAPPEKYGKHFDATEFYLSHMVIKKVDNIQSFHIATTGKLAKPKITAFTGKIESLF